MKVAFITLGCKVNSYETDAISDLFIKRGAVIVSSDDYFDVCIINTCSVTNQATAKSRKLIRSAKRNNPEAIIAVMGCYSQMDMLAVKELGVDIVLGNIDKASVVDLVYKQLEKREMILHVKDILKHKEFENLSPISFNRTRAFLKIEDGCNNFCSYCIIPFTRGPIRSKPANDVINEINKIVDNGYKEIVLTGIHTGKYNDNGFDFTSLIKRILNETKLERLRISSIELNEITDEFLEMMKDNIVLADHLHLPLQAGSDHVLKLMNRHYCRDEFINKINKIREYRPNISITTDIIVGFPEETDEDFNDTINLCKEVEFSKIHAFPFSLRKGTKAECYKEVKDIVKTNRMKELMALDKELEEKYYMKFVKTVQTIIVEDLHGEFFLGHSSNYLPILINDHSLKTGMMVNVLITEYKDRKLYAKLI